MGYKLKHTLMALAPAMLLHAAVWNALHPNMHSLPDIGIDEGVPSKWLAWARSTKFFKFLYVNHEGPHPRGTQPLHAVEQDRVASMASTRLSALAWTWASTPSIRCG